ncbi:hypothetical protein ACPA9J_34355 [Pseudomonas aeruginosa]
MIIADNRPSFSLTITRERTEDLQKTLDTLVEILGSDRGRPGHLREAHEAGAGVRSSRFPSCSNSTRNRSPASR